MYAMKYMFQIRTRAVSCKQMSMVTPLQLLMFAARNVTLEENNIVLDKWYGMILYENGFEIP